MSTPTVAVIGCGAIAERLHLPALARHPEVMARACLVDASGARAEAMARQFGAGRTASAFSDVRDACDAVIVLTPARLHHRFVLEALESGCHVLCEKPLAESVRQVDVIIGRANEAGRSVAVNNTRRLAPANRLVRELIADGTLGEVRGLDYVLGEPFDWPSAGDGYFGLKAAGRGIVADIGAHVLDLASWWLDGELTLESYLDDADGGTEAVADIRFTRGAVAGHVRLSWLSKLENRFRVRGTRATLEGEVYDAHTITVIENGRRTRRRADGEGEFTALGRLVIDNFLEVVRGKAAPLVSAADVRPSIALIDACYAARAPFPRPWHDAWERLADV